VLEQQSATLTTGALDFCSLPCLQQWVSSDAVRQHPAYHDDFHPPHQASETAGQGR